MADPFRLEKFTISSMVKKPNEVGDGFTEESTNVFFQNLWI